MHLSLISILVYCTTKIWFSDFTLCHIHLGSGIRYYTTITVCNTADLCTSVTSDGVVIDNSPPTKGTIQDGVDVYDVEYQSLRYLFYNISIYNLSILTSSQ
jgi:hypothetical protein